MAFSTTLGYPRIGRHRELKKASEGFWKGDISTAELNQVAADIKRENWLLQKNAEIDLIPSNDFSFYDQVLDTCALVGAIPPRYEWSGNEVDLATYFAMARGRSGEERGSGGIRAMEMTKWFDTNYHYIVPELRADQTFRLTSQKPVEEFKEALTLGVHTKPVLLGPVSFLLLAKVREGKGNDAGNTNSLDLIDRLLPVYEKLLSELAKAGAEWVQIDEPCLALDRTSRELETYEETFGRLARVSDSLKIFLATYFEGFRDNLETALKLPVSAVHIDVTRAPQALDAILSRGFRREQFLSLGVVDGRNVWKNDLTASLDILERAEKALGGDRLIVAPSCSLIHVPVDLDLEDQLDEEIGSWLAFAKQKLNEIHVLVRALNQGKTSVAEELRVNAAALDSRNRSSRIHKEHVKARVAGVGPRNMVRQSSFETRKAVQQELLQLPLLSTTTIGSFPQTAEVRQTRARFRKGEINADQYESFLRDEVRKVVALQEDLGLDVLVHGEFERNDMVEYFGEQLEGFAFTKHGWVQSYGSRYVKPPIIYGDVERPGPMSVRWSKLAASLTGKPVKGMLTGPVTILQWSFVRDDQPRMETCRQIALAIRDEVRDLERAGIPIIQIDEAALREGLPLRKEDWQTYLEWSVGCFRLASAGVRDATQVHTHMCYAEFNDIIGAIAAMDADVISIEASRSDMELLFAFTDFEYPNDICPGVYDIHSPRVPPVQEMVRLIEKALHVLRPDQLWINPDCGLKTRTYDEVIPALQNMVEAAGHARELVESKLARPEL